MDATPPIEYRGYIGVQRKQPPPRIITLDGDIKLGPLFPSEKAQELGNFIQTHRKSDIAADIHVFSSYGMASPEDYTDEQVMHEYRIDEDDMNSPIANAQFTITNEGYPKRDKAGTLFFARFAALVLSKRRHLLQYEPYDAGRGSNLYGLEAMHVASKELFSTGKTSEIVKNYSRINLGIVDRIGKLAMIRPFNREPFGYDLLAIVFKATHPTRNLEFKIHNHQLTEQNAIRAYH